MNPYGEPDRFKEPADRPDEEPTQYTREHDEIQKAIYQIQRDLVAPKGQYNNFGNYKYRSLEDVIAAVKKVMPENSSLNFTDEIVLVGERYYVKSTATFCYKHRMVSSTGWAREAAVQKGMNEPQLSGSSSSFARKYAIAGLFICDDNPDAETGASNESSIEKEKPTNQTKQKIEYITTDQAMNITELIREAGYTEEQIMKHWKVKDWRYVPIELYPRIVNALDKKIQEKSK